jgi:hypothetical protein
MTLSSHPMCSTPAVSARLCKQTTKLHRAWLIGSGAGAPALRMRQATPRLKERGAWHKPLCLVPSQHEDHQGHAACNCWYGTTAGLLEIRQGMSVEE